MDPLEFKPLDNGSREAILEYIRSRIDEADPVKLRQAMLSLGWVEDREELAGPLMVLVTGGKPDVALAALDGLSLLGIRDCEKPLARHIVNLFKANESAYGAVRCECIRVLGKVGTRRCVPFLAELVRSAAPATDSDKEAAVEALVSLAERRARGISELLEELRLVTGGVVRESIICALQELNLHKWEEQGFLTIEADIEREGSLFD
ncbi:MAG: hypothetical protein A3F83_15070 [Candidatus Glassbacteria bacterium RIFCSPLOWO2_12_FULL_58_11]|uniref:HEAT repeat domain-containing protein n=1 Tax=Candidatus Glassbacteria bacterium RIFCSPLOWO2_12_FULL_58_11 TaxID=1817867 RepID=A0A1F5YMW7_9BACT|nr:MAG: hypothetical protein A3F83_15070 [Candidatus Glassbacteria bacterium RIFCSPLOWO2_12_FULL_58_11]